MDRRQFLKIGSFVTVSTVAGGLAGCAGDGVPATSGPAAPGASGAGWKFPQSVASGDPRPDSILLWTRVVPSASDDVTSGAAVNLSVRVLLTDADNSAALGSNAALVGNLLQDVTVPCYAQYDNTVRHKITGLAAGKTYFYQFVAGDVRSKVGRFKTAPAQDADVTQLKFAFLTCQDWSINHWGAFEQIANSENPDFLVHLGDYIYETVGASFQVGAVESRHGALKLPDGTPNAGGSGNYATTLADYRYLYKKYRTDSRLQAVHERFAMIPIWDDHEFSDDCWQDAETYDNGSISAAGGDNVHQPARRRNANQAWFEFMPADVVLDNGAGINTIQIYRDFRFGKLAHLVMTDERLYRDDHIIPEAATNPLTGQAVGSIGARYMVPQDTLSGAEALKMAGGAGTADPLSGVSMLGRTQREWWKNTMKASTATWKLWGNEVSLLRMGVDGSNAIATLLALQAVTGLAGKIGEAAGSTGGNIAVASALVAAITAGASQASAAAAAVAIAGAAASGGNATAAAVAAGLTAQQAGLAAAAFSAAAGAAGAGSKAQAGAGAQVIAFGFIKPDVATNKAKSQFVAASGMQASLAPFFAKFVLNADQWDGYNAERKHLMKHLKDNGIKNVVAVTGDIHSFFAGTVSDDFDAANGGTPTMVDLVTAGISSDSFFSYLSSAVGSLSQSLSTLVYYPLTIPVPGIGSIAVNVNLLDYTMAKAAPTAASLAEQVKVQVRGALAAKGVPEAQLDATTAAVLAGLQADAGFTGQLLPLAQQLAGLNSNPWIKLANTDAQGYAVVTLTADKLSCEFRQVNRLVGGNAPAAVVARTVTATVLKDTAAVSIS
ncbi:alkaline phosphatase [Chitinimonas sp.]|uniref:alkaline phosphatase D family protein n=1 Tax=Chitinimonas sp. TaxID=1934313 RepID=UPI0035B0D627